MSGGLFGNGGGMPSVPTMTRSNAQFGAPTPNPTPAPTSGGLFGSNPPASTTTPGGGIFGQPKPAANPSPGGLFG